MKLDNIKGTDIDTRMEPFLYGLVGNSREDVARLMKEGTALASERWDALNDWTTTIYIPVIRRVYTILTDPADRHRMYISKRYNQALSLVAEELNPLDLLNYLNEKCTALAPITSVLKYVDLEAELADLMCNDYVYEKCEEKLKQLSQEKQ